MMASRRKRTRREHRRPRVVERRLVGEMTCRNGMCRYPKPSREATVLVEFPCLRYGERDEGYPEIACWVGRWLCSSCAEQEVRE